LIGEGDDSGGGVDIYKEKAEPVLVLLSNLYSKLDEISVSGSRPSSCPAYTILLTTFYYFLSQVVCNFDLRRLFYSRQCFKSICCSSACIDYKWALQHKAFTIKN